MKKSKRNIIIIAALAVVIGVAVTTSLLLRGDAVETSTESKNGDTSEESNDDNVTENIVLPPSRIGTEGQLLVDLDKKRSIYEAFEEADIVALIRVGNWLSEDNSYTRFEATVIEQYKGEPTTDLVVRQIGNSKHTLRGFPLFTYGNQMLLFLKKENIEPLNDYWIVGEYMAIDAIESDGEWYLLDRHGALGGQSGQFVNHEYEHIIDEYKKSDPIAKEYGYPSPFVYTRKWILERFKSLEGYND